MFAVVSYIVLAALAGAGIAWVARAAQVRLLREDNARLSSHLSVVKDMSDRFEALSAKVASESQKTFLTLAEENFMRREAAMQGLVEPMHKNLENLHKTVNEMEKNRHGAFSELSQNIALIRGDHEKLRSATSSLAQALRAPTARGRWGEIHLQRALEAVGMTESVDFVQQDMLKTDDSFQRPDVIVKLPGGRSIVIDAKAPIDAFLEAAAENISEDERKRALARHAEVVKGHIRKLGSKAYWEKLDSPEFVLMYLPGDAYYAAALEVDPTLFEAGIESKVFLMTPTTLFPTLRVIEHAWKQEKLAQNAREISALGQDLYKRLVVFGGHFDKMRKGLMSALDAYDSAVGSLEKNVLPAARRFRDMQGIGDDIASVPAIEQTPRTLKAPEYEEEKKVAS